MNERRPTGPNDPKDKRTPGLPRRFWTWWLVAAVILLIWNIFTLPRSGPGASTSIPYSTFLAEVRADDVTSVRITGPQITGTFRRPYTPPAPTATASPSSGSAPASPAPSYSDFATTFPEAVGDRNLIPLLDQHHVTIDVANPSGSWVTQLLVTWGPLLLIAGVLLWMNGRAARSLTGQMSFGRAKPQRYESDRPKVTFNDVAGADEAKEALQEEVDFLRNPAKYHRLGARIPRGVLLVGAPGTGKTLMARAVAGEAGVPFLSLNASEFVEMFVGVGASRVRDLFEQAKKIAPAIVFIDELDAVGRRRGAGVGAVNDEREQTLNQLLGELDGFDPRAEIIVLAATNRPDVLDPALLRPGRFDRQVTVDLPDRRGRFAILQIHSRELKLAPDVDLETIAAMTVGLSGAELANLCNEAALAAARHDHDNIRMIDFEEAHDRIRLGAAHAHLVSEEERRVVAYHESGHALVAWLTPFADPVRKVTIVPHGQALGVTEQLPDIERHNLSRADLDARLCVMMGGRAAEELVFDMITTGAESDLVSATQLARRMVTRWGMGEIGVVAFASDEQQPFLGYEMSHGRDYSEATASRIDRGVEDLLERAHESARASLRSARERLDKLAEELLRSETVDVDELERILGPRLVPAPTNPGL